MKCHYLIVLYLQVSSTFSAPLQMQWQSQMSVQPTQEELLQQQLFAIQQLQAINEWNSNSYPPIQKMDQPLMIIMPDAQLNTRLSTNYNNVKNTVNRNDDKDDETDNVTINEDLDSITIDSETSSEPQPEYHPQKAFLLLPTRGRFGIGGLISAIPFLPIEINVPDTISWIYNGIAGIIGGIGQRLPFNRPQPTEIEQSNLRVLLNRLQTRNQNNASPILLLPDIAQMYPMQF